MDDIPPLHANAPESTHSIDARHRGAKVVHIIRHGRGYHNGVRSILTQFQGVHDAHLNELGWTQCQSLNDELKRLEVEVDLVVVSPLRRTLETAAGLFGHPYSPDDDDSNLLMVEQGGRGGKRTAHEAIGRPHQFNIVALELIRESLGVDDSNKRRNIQEQARAFPGVDFSYIEYDDDMYWSTANEGPVKQRARGRKFTEWLLARPEKRIAVVSHQRFIYEWCQNFVLFSVPQDEQKDLHRVYVNCEMQSIVLFDQTPIAVIVNAAHLPLIKAMDTEGAVDEADIDEFVDRLACGADNRDIDLLHKITSPSSSNTNTATPHTCAHDLDAAIRSELERSLPDMAPERLDGFVSDIKRDLNDTTLSRLLRIIGEMNELHGDDLEEFINAVTALAPNTTSPHARVPTDDLHASIHEVVSKTIPSASPERLDGFVADIKREMNGGDLPRLLHVIGDMNDVHGDDLEAFKSTVAALASNDSTAASTPSLFTRMMHRLVASAPEKIAALQASSSPSLPQPIPCAAPDGIQTGAAEHMLHHALVFVDNNAMRAHGDSVKTPETENFVESAMIPTYIAPDWWMSKKGFLADIYDNGLVINMLAASAHLSSAHHDLAWDMTTGVLSRMAKDGWDHGGESSPNDVHTRVEHMNLLCARYERDGTPASGLLPEDETQYVYMEGDTRDIGNNIMMGLGLFKFGATFKYAPAVRAAYDMVAHIAATRKCCNGAPGYEARVPRVTNVGDPCRPGGVKNHQWIAFEHHIDLLALCNGLLPYLTSASAAEIGVVEDTGLLESVRDVCIELANMAWVQGDNELGFFISGAGSAEDLGEGRMGDLQPVDTNTWLALSTSPENGLDDKVRLALEHAVDTMLVCDTNTNDLGCGHVFKSQVPCESVDEADKFRGFKFSQRGFGIQWENTGAGMIALMRMFPLNAGNAKMVAAIETLRGSIEKMFSQVGDGGVPASFHEMKALEAAYDDPSQFVDSSLSGKQFNTGFSWNYYKAPHTAATVYCGMAMMYYESWAKGEGGECELFNTYGAYVRAVGCSTCRAADLTKSVGKWSDMDAAETRGLRVWDIKPTYHVTREGCCSEPLTGYFDSLHNPGNFDSIVAGTVHDRIRNGGVELVMEGDGDLALYDGGEVVWTSGTGEGGRGHYTFGLGQTAAVVYELDGVSARWKHAFAGQEDCGYTVEVVLSDGQCSMSQTDGDGVTDTFDMK